MMKSTLRRVSALLIALCLLLGSVSLAETASGADLEALYPLMDLVCGAAYDPATGTALVIPDSEGVLELTFVDQFIRLAQQRSEMGVTEAIYMDTQAQTNLLQAVFAAQVPQTRMVVPDDSVSQYIGFQPVTVNNTGDSGSLQIVGEMYMAPKAFDQLGENEFASVQWLDRAIFTFKSDATAYAGFRLMGFSTGIELNVEEEMQAYSESIVVEYVNTKLGFMVLYPSVFTDEMLVEDANGVSAKLPDGSASFFARRDDNVNGLTLADHVAAMGATHADAAVEVNEELYYGTVSYIADGYAYFDVYVVTEGYVYQAQLSYRTDLMGQYSMYNSYLLNSFGVDELAAG